MGVPAFYRWLSEKYPKIVEDVLEERVKLVSNDGSGFGSMRLPFDSTRPNPSGLETDNLYIDMNGIIHPCSHPEVGPQPTTEAEMYENVCKYVDRLVRTVRPRKLLYLAIDGVAPRAKMNQQRSRRFRSAQEARDHAELEEHIRQELVKAGQGVPPSKKPWDSNVITPGTPFMLNLATHVRFYIRKRISTDKAWKNIVVIFSDASLPGEGEHKIMEHVRLQRSQPGYNPNTVHVLHGLDADLIMLALATHEMHFYILREVVTFGRKSLEQMEQRQLESGFQDAQRHLDEEAGPQAMSLPENQQKPLQRVSIPILREYLANEFASCLAPGALPFAPSLERLIDDVVFLCFFVGNDFLPHLPSLDIRDGALDFLFNVYKRVLPTFGDFITSHGGQVNLSHVDVILAEVGAIEDYVFAMKHSNEEREQQRREEMKERRQSGQKPDAPPVVAAASVQPLIGRTAKILEKRKREHGEEQTVALGRGHVTKEEARKDLKAKKMVAEANAQAALELKKSLLGARADKKEIKLEVTETKSEEMDIDSSVVKQEEEVDVDDMTKKEGSDELGMKRKLEEIESDSAIKAENENRDQRDMMSEEEAEFEDDVDGDDNDADEEDEVEEIIEEEAEKVEVPAEIDPELAKAFKEKIKLAKAKQLDEFSKNVEDKVRLHEKGWKDRYYTDKCKAEDVAENGGREHMYRSYVSGLCWVMKYYYDGCPSWKWYYPFHYAPFASDLRNIERFQKDCKSLELHEPFKPVEQLMAVLPEDSSHAIPKKAQWLMSDEESPIIDFYPKDVPVDPNGKAMPWLWVVLLPFIDEERLLAAMRPTTKEWTKQELLCNARGLDNGYLYVHISNKLMEKLSCVFKDSIKYTTSKLRLTDSSSYGKASGLFGSVRLPLSNEIYPVDEDVKISPPGFPSKIARVDDDSLFSEPVENTAVCVAFTEASKLPHKSVVLPGAKPPRPILNSEDRRIRRPRLNRGGATIANMGMSNGQSHQSGYGSMNISSYERNLANQTGRGNQMHQAGTRQWGAMEPVPKRRHQEHVQHPAYPSNPFNRGPSRGGQGNRPDNDRPPWQHGGSAQHSQHVPPGFQNLLQPPHNAPAIQQGYSQPRMGYQQQPRYGYSQPQGSYGGGYQQGPPPPPRFDQQHSFQGYNRSAPEGNGLRNSGYGNRPQHQNQPPSRVDQSRMNDLRSQLASTLNQNSRRGGQNDGSRR